MKKTERNFDQKKQKDFILCAADGSGRPIFILIFTIFNLRPCNLFPRADGAEQNVPCVVAFKYRREEKVFFFIVFILIGITPLDLFATIKCIGVAFYLRLPSSPPPPPSFPVSNVNKTIGILVVDGFA